MMNVLVTGASGFTGGNLCKHLINEGYNVTALVRDIDKVNDLRRAGVKLTLGDLRDKHTLNTAVKGIDIVFHIAALYRQASASKKDLWDVNVQGTKNILEASENAGVKRLIHCSTVGVHGEIKNPPADESYPYAPGDAYQESKTEGEKIAIEYMRKRILPVIIVRPSGIHGPGDLRFLKLFKSIKKNRFIMIGDGKTLYHMVYIDDLIDGILLCAKNDNAVGNIYILAGDKPITLNRLVEIIANCLKTKIPNFSLPFAPVYFLAFLVEILCIPLGIEPPLFRRRVDFFRKDRAFDISKAKIGLGYIPKTKIEKGLENLAEWYIKEGLL